MARAPRQGHLPAEGMTRPPGDPEIEEAGEEYRLVRDERMAMASKEREAKKKLISMMESKNVTTYLYTDDEGNERKITLESKKNAKVAKIRPSDPDDDIDATDVNVQ